MTEEEVAFAFAFAVSVDVDADEEVGFLVLGGPLIFLESLIVLPDAGFSDVTSIFEAASTVNGGRKMAIEHENDRSQSERT